MSSTPPNPSREAMVPGRRRHWLHRPCWIRRCRGEQEEQAARSTMTEGEWEEQAVIPASHTSMSSPYPAPRSRHRLHLASVSSEPHVCSHPARVAGMMFDWRSGVGGRGGRGGMSAHRRRRRWRVGGENDVVPGYHGGERASEVVVLNYPPP